MMTSIVSFIRTYSTVLWDMFLSVIGCFILRRCFRLVAAGRGCLETSAPVSADEQLRDPLVFQCSPIGAQRTMRILCPDID